MRDEEPEYIPYRINSDPARGWVPLCLIVVGVVLFLLVLPLIIPGAIYRGPR